MLDLDGKGILIQISLTCVSIEQINSLGTLKMKWKFFSKKKKIKSIKNINNTIKTFKILIIKTLLILNFRIFKKLIPWFNIWVSKPIFAIFNHSLHCPIQTCTIILRVNYINDPYPLHYISIWSLTFQLCQFDP